MNILEKRTDLVATRGMAGLVDTHSHLHDVEVFELSAEEIIENAHNAGVGQIVVVGTDVENSRRAVEFAQAHDGVYATVGIHPGETPKGTIADLEEIIVASLRAQRSNLEVVDGPGLLRRSTPRKDALVGFGDIGLDYHYSDYDKEQQIDILKQQLELAVKYDLPVSFHVREAFDDFWPIFDQFPGLRGVLHSFTDNVENMQKGLERGLYISINGILTFNKDEELNKVFTLVPLDRVLFETDAPYLAPTPHRGKQNQPAFVADIAKVFARNRGISFEEIAQTTTLNAKKVFHI